MTDYNLPVSGRKIFSALKGEKLIVMAANIRTQLSTRGIMEAAKELDAAVLFEIAKSEIGYTGQSPQDFYDGITGMAAELDFNTPYAIHGDHITIKDSTPESTASARKLIEDEVAAGFTSYAIDASHNFNFDGKTVREQLSDNIAITVELADLIPSEACLEVEVGEVGRTNADGTKKLTSVEESVTFIEALQEQGVKPDLLAINNGTIHGNIFDEQGNIVEQVGIDIATTKAIADAIAPLGVRIAQHGITGTPLRLMHLLIDAGIAKGNVGTNWQNVVVENLPGELLAKMNEWTLACEHAKKMLAKKPKISQKELIAKNIKHSIKVHKDELMSVSCEYRDKINSATRQSALDFFKAFQAQGSGAKVRG
ncbi:MAG: class II fructose-bisphosphate aldolase [Candidatus Altiarchaeota archaeon]